MEVEVVAPDIEDEIFTGEVKIVNTNDAGDYDIIDVSLSTLKPDAPTITGSTSGSPGTEYEYTFKALDPDRDDLYYYIEWDDGDIEEWDGPHASGAEVKLSHTWSEGGTYTIRAKVKDDYDMESDWGELTVTMPRNRAINRPFLNFLESHPNLFPILRLLLQRLGL